MSSGDLYGRTWRLRVGSVEMDGLDIEFDVKKTLKREPNTATIKIYNLSAKSRQAISQKDVMPVALEAGYGGRNSLIYLGQTRGAVSTKEQPDIVSVLETGDSEKEHRGSRISVPVGPSTSIDTAMKLIAGALKVKPGNTAALAAKLKAKGVALFPVPTTFSGTAVQAVTDFARSAGLDWSVQDGALQFLDRGGALDAQPYILGGSGGGGGLVGSPTIDSKGIVNATALILPDVRPGLRVIFQAKFVKGLFRIAEAQYQGDSRSGGSPWYVNLTCEKVKAG